MSPSPAPAFRSERCLAPLPNANRQFLLSVETGQAQNVTISLLVRRLSLALFESMQRVWEMGAMVATWPICAALMAP